VHFDAALTNDNVWHTVSLAVSSFIGAVLPADVAANLGVVEIQVISATTGTPTDISAVFSVDNMMFTN
jgi:hypothetical protein